MLERESESVWKVRECVREGKQEKNTQQTVKLTIGIGTMAAA